MPSTSTNRRTSGVPRARKAPADPSVAFCRISARAPSSNRPSEPRFNLRRIWEGQTPGITKWRAYSPKVHSLTSLGGTIVVAKASTKSCRFSLGGQKFVSTYIQVGRMTYIIKVLSLKDLGELCFSPPGVLFRDACVPSVQKIKLYRDYISLSSRREFVIKLANSLTENDVSPRARGPRNGLILLTSRGLRRQERPSLTRPRIAPT
jgi:hypothetical protein